MIRVLLADDEPLIRSGLRMLLTADDEIEVVAEAWDGREAVAKAGRFSVDVVLMDVAMPDMDGIEATRRIATSVPSAHVVILTTFETDENIFRALRAGASGFVVKTAPPQHIVDAVRLAARGESLLSPSVARRIVADVARRPRPDEQLLERLVELTPRELEVLRLVGGGATNREIAEALHLSEATVKSHFGRVLAKLSLRDRVQAVILAYEAGLVVPDSG